MKTFKRPFQSTLSTADNIALYRAYTLVTLVCLLLFFLRDGDEIKRLSNALAGDFTMNTFTETL